MELVLGDVGAAGALPVEAVASELTAHLHAFSHCFESAAGLSKPIHGTHWLAFEIAASGALGRVEWVDRPLEDELLDACVRSALSELRLPPAGGSTLVDMQLQSAASAGFSSRCSDRSARSQSAMHTPSALPAGRQPGPAVVSRAAL